MGRRALVSGRLAREAGALLAAVASARIGTAISDRWIEAVFARLVVGPFAKPLLARWRHRLPELCVVLAGSVFAFAGMSERFHTDPILGKVYASAGVRYADGQRSLAAARRGRWDEACALTCHAPGGPGLACAVHWPPYRRTLDRAVRELGALTAITAVLTRRRPSPANLARSFAFYLTTFTGVRWLSCAAAAACRAWPSLNNSVALKAVLPYWLGLSMLCLRLESPERQAQVATFLLSSATAAVARHTALWPAKSSMAPAVACGLYPTVARLVAGGIARAGIA